MSAKPPRRIEVAAAVIERDGKFLIAQRPPGVHLGGYWEFPGGKREPGEAWDRCLVREIREELGAEVDVGEIVFETWHDYPDRTVHLRFFRCRLLAGDPFPREVAAIEWVDPGNLRRYPFPPADEELLSLLESSAGTTE